MTHRYPKRSQLKYTKKPYKVRNWREYEAGLCKRGELTLWFSEEAIEAWHANARARPGGQRIYSDIAIETALTVRIVYSLALRQTEGFLRSIATLLDLRIRIPDHSTLSRRSKLLECKQRGSTGAGESVHILVDSTGLKVHRGTKCPPLRNNRRAWRKLHLVVDAVSAEILASELTTYRTRDASPVPDLLRQVGNDLASVAADGAYDTAAVYEVIARHSSEQQPTRVVISPRRNARLGRISRRAASQRDHHVQSIHKIGRRRWQKASGYTRRRLVETAMFRYKTIIGRRLRSRTWPSQRTEVQIGCAILNKMTQQGMPDSYCAA